MTSIPAFADDPYQPQVVPTCKVYATVDGDVCGYRNIDDWKAVLRADAELVHVRDQLKNELARTSALAMQLVEIRRQVGIYTSSIATLTGRNTTLTGQLIELDLKYQKERASSGFWSPVPWAITGVAVSVLAGVLLAGLVN